MAEEIVKNGGTVMTSAAAVSFTTQQGAITGVNVETAGGLITVPCDKLISSIPLPVFTGLLPSAGSFNGGKAAALSRNLQTRAVYLVYLLIESPGLTRDHWIFFPGKEVIFGRVFEQKNLSEKMAPPGKTVLCCDFTDTNGGPMSLLSDAELAARCAESLRNVNILSDQKVESSLVRRFEGFYPRYGINYKDNLLELFSQLKSFSNLLLTGRVGFYNYNNLDHCVDMGRFIADNLANGKTAGKIWDELFERVENYRIVD